MEVAGQKLPWNALGNLSSNDIRQSRLAVNTNASRDGNDIITTDLGADYALSPAIAVGITAAFYRGDGSGLNSDPVNTSVNNLTSKGQQAGYFCLEGNWTVKMMEQVFRCNCA